VLGDATAIDRLLETLARYRIAPRIADAAAFAHDNLVLSKERYQRDDHHTRIVRGVTLVILAGRHVLHCTRLIWPHRPELSARQKIQQLPGDPH
jgi:hypothetical protein